MKKKIFLIAIFTFIIHYSLFINHCESQWIPYTLPYDGYANTLGFYDLNNGVSCGHTSNIIEKIYYTTNSGINWILATYPPELRAIINVQFINASTIYACGAQNGIISNNYNSINDFISYPKNVREKLLREGVREYYTEYKGAFIKSTNGGVSWQKGSQFDTTKGYINDIFFFDVNNGYALIDSNPNFNTKFCKTTNAGISWQVIKLIEPNSRVEKMIFFDMNTGIAKGFNFGGRIYKTTNGGFTWVTTIMASQIDGITFFNSTTGIAIGFTDSLTKNNIYRSTNTGNNWNLIATINGSNLYQNLKSIPSSGTAFAVGNVIDLNYQLGKITTLKTTSFGSNWVSKEFNPIIIASGISLIDQNNFFISGGFVGPSAMILKSTNGGNVFVNQVGSEIPSSFLLQQNYPNPFNPLTKVEFSIMENGIKENGFVMLKVYDILGKEIATLVNEKLQPGTYEVTFDGSKVNSGVYFYRLITPSFTETKKMLLIK